MAGPTAAGRRSPRGKAVVAVLEEAPTVGHGLLMKKDGEPMMVGEESRSANTSDSPREARDAVEGCDPAAGIPVEGCAPAGGIPAAAAAPREAPHSDNGIFEIPSLEVAGDSVSCGEERKMRASAPTHEARETSDVGGVVSLATAPPLFVPTVVRLCSVSAADLALTKDEDWSLDLSNV